MSGQAEARELREQLDTAKAAAEGWEQSAIEQGNEAHEKTKALEALAAALKGRGAGNYWLARRFLEERDEYSGDLSDLYLLERVALKALGQ